MGEATGPRGGGGSVRPMNTALQELQVRGHSREHWKSPTMRLPSLGPSTYNTSLEPL